MTATLSTLASINNLGLLFKAQGKLEEAEPLYREALEGKRATLGDRHLTPSASINNLGLLFQDQGKLEEAEPLFREALEGMRATLGDRHPHTSHPTTPHDSCMTWASSTRPRSSSASPWKGAAQPSPRDTG